MDTIELQPLAFKTEPYAFQMVFKTASPSTWSYTLPEINVDDDDMENVSIFVDVGKASFVTFNKGKLVIADLSDATILLK